MYSRVAGVSVTLQFRFHTPTYLNLYVSIWHSLTRKIIDFFFHFLAIIFIISLHTRVLLCENELSKREKMFLFPESGDVHTKFNKADEVQVYWKRFIVAKKRASTNTLFERVSGGNECVKSWGSIGGGYCGCLQVNRFAVVQSYSSMLIYIKWIAFACVSSRY